MSILFSDLGGLAYLRFAGAVFLPIWRIFARAGLNPAWSFLLVLLPMLRAPCAIALAWWFAFRPWPAMTAVAVAED
jgi:hypothetical protein